MAKAAQTNMDGAAGYVTRIEDRNDHLLSLRMDYMRECKAVREEIRLILDEADDAGFKKRAIRAVVKTRELESKAAAIRDELDEEFQNDFDNIRHALGDLADTPLGDAAVRAA